MKLRKAMEKIIPYLIISAILLMSGLYVYGKSQQYNEIKYSTYNVKSEGGKALYLLTGEMGYNIYRHESSAAFFPQGVTMVIMNPDQLYLSKLELHLIKEWLEKGNTLIFVGYKSLLSSRFNEIAQKQYSTHNEELLTTHYKVNKGSFVFIEDFNQFTNKKLKDHKPAVEFIMLLKEAGSEAVYFNEYYHGIGKNKVAGWNIMSLGMQLAVLQLAIAAVLITVSLARRFGVPVIVHEIVKRQENEKIFALSNIFIKARANSVVLEIYQEKFIKELAKYLGFPHGAVNEELMDAANRDAALKKASTIEVMKRCQDYINKKEKGTKELASIIHRLDEIRKVIKE